MKRFLALLLVSLPASAAELNPPALIGPISAPVAAKFPVATAGEFFGGAPTIVDLGGEVISPWTIAVARSNPAARVDVVNMKELAASIEHVRAAWSIGNIHAAEYDFFKPPEGHPRGARVVVNSPSFGGVADIQAAEAFADMVARHMEPGGLAYIHADDNWFMSIDEQMRRLKQDVLVGQLFKKSIPGYLTTMEEVATRREIVVAALAKRFGSRNLHAQELKGYDLERRLNVTHPKYTIQLQKPR
jgi:hypothetical protein